MTHLKSCLDEKTVKRPQKQFLLELGTVLLDQKGVIIYRFMFIRTADDGLFLSVRFLSRSVLVCSVKRKKAIHCWDR